VKICEADGCSDRATARGLCVRHYQRLYMAHRDRSDQLVANRARNRARARLVELHREEYEALVEQEMPRAKAEQDALEAKAGADERVRLLPGKKAKSEQLEQRIRSDVGTCPKCIGYHDKGHACPACGASPHVPPRKTPEQKIADLLSLGKTPQWIADNLGEPMHLVMAVAQRAAS